MHYVHLYSPVYLSQDNTKKPLELIPGGGARGQVGGPTGFRPAFRRTGVGGALGPRPFHTTAATYL
jgi:hypothetical protein